MASRIIVLKLVLLNVLHSAFANDIVHFGLMSVRSMNQPVERSAFCITLNPLFQIPKTEEAAMPMSLVNLVGGANEDLCELSNISLPFFNGSAVAVKRGNCTFSEKAANVQTLGGSAVLIVSQFGLQEPWVNSTSDPNQAMIIVAMILASDFEHIEVMGRNISVKFYSPDAVNYDMNLLFIWLTATFTVIVGSYWAGNIQHQIWLRKSGLSFETGQHWQVSEKEARNNVHYSPKIIILIVIIMCVMLLGLYFFYDYLIYVIIVLFALASSFALYEFLWLLITLVLPPFATCRIPSNKFYYLKTRPEYRQLVLVVMCLAVGVWWFIERHKSYSWVLQDILGVAFCVQMMKNVRLPSLKICFILLILLFIYDIFFVFITPLFTKDGSSIMVDIATGRGSSSGERLPIVLMFPKMNAGELGACFLPFSLLGFGDIFVPGLLVSFCFGFDLQIASGGVYFLVTSIAYGIGLALTFVALVIMKKGQPALLYLVPCTLIAVSVMSLVRKEFYQMWTGKMKPHHSSFQESEDLNLSQSSRTVVKVDYTLDYSSAGEEDKMLADK